MHCTVDPSMKETWMLRSTTVNLICTDFYVYFPNTAQSALLRHWTMCRVLENRSLAQKSFTSFALWRHLHGNAACKFENGIVVEKRAPFAWEKVSNFKPTAATEPQVSKKAKPRRDKDYFFMPNHFEYWALKMSTGQPWWRRVTMTTTSSNEDMLPWQQLTAMKTWTFVWDILALQNFQIGTCQHQNFWEKFWWNHINLHCSPSTLHSSFCTISFRWCMLNISRENFWHTVSSELTLGAAAWNRISWTAVVLVLIMEITATRVSGRLGLAWSLAKCIMTLMQLLSYTDTGVNVPVMNRNGSEGTCIEQKREWRYLYWSDTGLNVLE